MAYLHKHLKLNRENRMKHPFRRLVIASLLATTGAFSVSTHAAPVKDKTVEKLMQVSDIKNIVKSATYV